MDDCTKCFYCEGKPNRNNDVFFTCRLHTKQIGAFTNLVAGQINNVEKHTVMIDQLTQITCDKWISPEEARIQAKGW